MSPNITRLDHVRRRSVGFLEREGESWACFLVTYRDREMTWHGYFSFRSKDGDLGDDEVRTADIFIESSEEEIARKARGLGRPLLNGLLASAVHTAEQADRTSPRLRHWFRETLSRSSMRLAGAEEAGQSTPGAAPGGDASRRGASRNVPASGPEVGGPKSPELHRMRSLYESYRLDQVVHFICLVRPDHLRVAVDRILDGKPIDFGAKDRLQFAMIVVEYIESRLPLPPFEVWAEDFVANRDEYRLYAHTLHREKRLP